MSDTRPTPLSDDERRELDHLRAKVEELRAHAPADPVAPRRRHRLRGVAGILVIVLGCVLAPLAVVATWLEAQVTDTDAYVETVTPLIDDPAVQDALAAAVTSEVFTRLDVQDTAAQALQALVDRTDLPPLVEDRIVGLAVPLTNGVEGFVEDQVDSLVASQDFREAWIDANRVAHEELVAAMTGSEGGAVQVTEGTVSVSLAPFVNVVKDRLVDRGLTVAENIPDVQASFVVMQSADLARAQNIFALLDTVGAALPFVVLGILAVGVLLAVDRRRALVGAGLGLAVSMVVLAAGIALARAGYLGAVPEDVLPRPAAASIFDTLVRFLRTGLRTALLLGLLVAAAAFLAGPAQSAVRARGWLRRGVSGLRGLGSGSEGLAGARVGHQVRAARRPLQVLTVAVAGLVLAFWDRPSPAVLLTVALLAVLALVLIEVLASSADYPSARARSLEPGSAPPALPAAGEAGTDGSALPDQREATTEADRTHSSA